MAVTTLYMSDLDKQKRTFTDKKLCDELDRKLELAEHLRLFLESNIHSLQEDMAENIAMLLADHKDRLMTALKGRPSVLTEPEEVEETEKMVRLDSPQDEGSVPGVDNVKAIAVPRKAG
jgi:dsDNA-binding SOS-regulon protein